MRSKTFRFPVTTLVGSNISNIVALLRSHRVQPKYYGKFLLTFIIAGILEIFNTWEKIRFGKRIKNTEFSKPPLFIIGVWRSGTTLLHNILSQDPKAAYTTTLHAVFPHLVLSQGWWISRVVNVLMPALRPFDNVRMDAYYSQEEEYGMSNIFEHSLYRFWMFPGDFDEIISQDLFYDNLPEDVLARWRHDYTRLMRKAMLDTGGDRYISKNPCNTTRIRLLKEMFPDGKYIFIYRNPYTVVESFYRFALAIFPGVELQKVAPDFSREKIAAIYSTMMRRYFEDRHLLTESSLVEIRMEDFVKDKEGNLRMFYEKLGLDGFDAALPKFRAWLSANSGYSRDLYEIHPDTYKYVNQYASDIVEKLGYPVLNAALAM